MIDLDASATARLIASAADVALVLDDGGIVRDVSIREPDEDINQLRKSTGRHFADLVTKESRQKVMDMIDQADNVNPGRWRQVNHPMHDGDTLPVQYSTMRIGNSGYTMALGRDLRPLSAMQQRLMDAQRSMERDYSELRRVETRYRMLFQMSSEAILIVDATSRKVVEANPSVGRLFEHAPKDYVGKSFPHGFDEKSSNDIVELLEIVRGAGRANEIKVRRDPSGREFILSASLIRQDAKTFFLVKLSPMLATSNAELVPRSKLTLLRVIEGSPDGFVVTDAEGRVLAANDAFLDLCDLATEEQAKGHIIDRWLGRPGVELAVLKKTLGRDGSIRKFGTTLRTEYDSVLEVELSAVAALDSDTPCLGFTLRNVTRNASLAVEETTQLPKSIEKLVERVGQVPLKELVRETTDVIERKCIEAALELTQDNRASAAEMLGLSRQSLYVKMRRYGLGELDPDE